MAGASTVSGFTTCPSQTFSKSVRGMLFGSMGWLVLALALSTRPASAPTRGGRESAGLFPLGGAELAYRRGLGAVRGLLQHDPVHDVEIGASRSLDDVGRDGAAA